MKLWTFVGLLATLIIAAVLPWYAYNESNRMAHAQTELLADSIAMGEEIYAENCVVCHGSDGQGISAYPGLANEGVQTMDYDSIFKVIERGRYDTAMAGWGVGEGGVLNDMEIDQLIAMIQYGDWQQTAHTVEALGLAPPTVITVEVSDEILAEISALPHGNLLAAALPVYAANCAACHGANGEGTAIAPALNSADLRAGKTDDELGRIIANGVPGTLMAGWDKALPAADIENLVALMRYWDEVPANALPQPELPPIASTDAEVIASGAQLYSVACGHCHGPEGQGTPMAPALNVQNFLTDTNDQAIKAIISQGVPDTRMPAWGGRLTDDQLNALVSFIRAWEPTAPATANPTRPGAGAGTGTAPNSSGGMGPPWMRSN